MANESYLKCEDPSVLKIDKDKLMNFLEISKTEHVIEIKNLSALQLLRNMNDNFYVKDCRLYHDEIIKSNKNQYLYIVQFTLILTYWKFNIIDIAINDSEVKTQEIKFDCCLFLNGWLGIRNFHNHSFYSYEKDLISLTKPQSRELNQFLITQTNKVADIDSEYFKP